MPEIDNVMNHTLKQHSMQKSENYATNWESDGKRNSWGVYADDGDDDDNVDDGEDDDDYGDDDDDDGKRNGWVARRSCTETQQVSANQATWQVDGGVLILVDVDDDGGDGVGDGGDGDDIEVDDDDN